MHVETLGRNGEVIVAGSHRVLRNTYLLLGLSLIPTVLGAVIGTTFNMGALFAGSPFLSFLMFVGVAFGFFWGIERHKDSGLGVALLLGFTFFMGLMLSRILQTALGFSNGGSLIAMAGGGTAAIFLTLAGIASNSRRDFSNLGKFLFVGLVVVLLASIGNIFLQLPMLALTISAVSVMLFSAYILYDINRIVQGGETNYVTATLSVYLDIYNVFVSLLNLVMALGGERD